MSIPIPVDRSIVCYRNAAARSFEFFKRTTLIDDLYAKSLRLSDGAGYLLPTCDLHVDDDALIADLTRSRNEDVAAYPSQFVATPTSTKAWLRDRVLAAPDRMLFLVVNKFGRIVGHMGFASAINDDGSLEMDNIVRGVKAGDPGIMARGMTALIDWAEEKLGPRKSTCVSSRPTAMPSRSMKSSASCAIGCYRLPNTSTAPTSTLSRRPEAKSRTRILSA